jgi:hypothetical protein
LFLPPVSAVEVVQEEGEGGTAGAEEEDAQGAAGYYVGNIYVYMDCVRKASVKEGRKKGAWKENAGKKSFFNLGLERYCVNLCPYQGFPRTLY